MSWIASDADNFKQGLSKKQKKKWASIANGALESCMSGGGSEKECKAKAIRIATSKFNSDRASDAFKVPFNPVFDQKLRFQNMSEFPHFGNVPQTLLRILKLSYSMDGDIVVAWQKAHKAGWYKEDGKWLKREVSTTEKPKKYQYQKTTPPDPQDGHTHTAAFDEDGNGMTSVDGDIEHAHMVYNFKVQPFYTYDQEEGKEYVSAHPGSVAFAELGEVEMEIFRIGTHNGDKFSESDLEEMARNFHALKSELRPKLKLTHREDQQSLGGLASYGDIVDVYMKPGEDGEKRLFAKVTNIPKQVLDFIKDRRFPERSIELYPEFKLGTKESSPVYKNVLKAVALLGHEMPAVTGMAPIKMEECLECQGTVCLFQKFDAQDIVPCPKCGFGIDVDLQSDKTQGSVRCSQCGRILTAEEVAMGGVPKVATSEMASDLENRMRVFETNISVESDRVKTI